MAHCLSSQLVIHEEMERQDVQSGLIVNIICVSSAGQYKGCLHGRPLNDLGADCTIGLHGTDWMSGKVGDMSSV
jgi:hypothetical protein